MNKILFISATEIGVKAFLTNHLHALSKNYHLALFVNTNNPSFLMGDVEDLQVNRLNISREINVFHDLIALSKLAFYLLNRSFDVIHSISPKAGLISMIAGFLTKTPIRIHTFTGQVWANKVGFKRFYLKYFDKLIATLSTHVIVDSPSQLDYLISEGVLNKSKAFVFGKGSVSGVDIDKFKPMPQSRALMRCELKVEEHELLFLFLGRLNTDKGVLDLAHAFIQANLLHCKLLFVGPDEGNMQAKITSLLNFDYKKISFIGYTDLPQNFMVAADVLCLPSYREGFGSVIIEAAACGTPALASRIYGITDAVVENETGLLHEPKNINEIAQKLKYLAENPSERKQLGKNAHERAVAHFDSKLITQAWCDFYRDLFEQYDKKNI